MKAKWYISTLFLIFLYFGAYQEQVSSPNQEIVLEFVDTKINNEDIESTIADIKEKLQNIGVSNINIKKSENGTLKIAYYSAVHIDNIKKELVAENSFVLNQNSDKKEQNKGSFNYNIDIYEITNESEISNLDFKYVLEVKYNSDRFTTHNYYAFLKKFEQSNINQRYKTAFKSNKSNIFIEDKSSYKEPEVRAGPKHLFC